MRGGLSKISFSEQVNKFKVLVHPCIVRVSNFECHNVEIRCLNG